MSRSNSPENENTRTNFQALTREIMLRVNRYCDQLESAWQNSDEVVLPDFLSAIPVQDRADALFELIAIDCSWRGARGLPNDDQWYVRLFPELDKAQLQKILRHARTQATGALRDKLAEQERAKQGLPDDTAPVPQSLGDYVITGSLGEGGMGRVYRAVHQLMKREVAIKVMREKHLKDSESRRRFEREVEVIARLSHPNIVSAFDAREEQGTLYMVTELVEGEDLARLVARKGPLKPRDAMYYAWQAAKGLGYAHSKGIVHRDVKPGNLILERKKTIKVLDLGLARLNVSEDADKFDGRDLTSSGIVLGTSPYLSPEQARAPLEADARSDVYSLGCTLYFLITGKPPFRGRTEVDTILAHFEQPVPHLPESINERRVPPGLNELLQRMMAKSPEDRLASMEEVVEALESLIRALQQERSQTGPAELLSVPAAHFPSLSKPSLLSFATGRRGVRQWLAAVSMVIVLLAIVLVSTYLLGRFGQQQPNGFGSDSNQQTAGGAETDRDPPAIVPGDTSKNVEDQNQLISGLSFNGDTSFVVVEGFQDVIEGPFRFEVAATPNRQQRPANLVTWSGPRLAALFISSPGRWGIAWYDGTQSRLVVAKTPVRYGELQLVAGQWDGQELSLFIDGKRVAVDAAEYELRPASIGLYFGGSPHEVTPTPETAREFDGLIAAVRVEHGKLSSHVSTSIAEMRRATPNTFVCFPFTENSGNVLKDLGNRRMRGSIRGAVWR